MKKRQMIYSIFVICILFTILIVVFSQKNKASGLGMATQFLFAPLQKTVLHTTVSIMAKTSPQDITEENKMLKMQIAKLQLIAQDNTALRDQFHITHPSPHTLLPATIVGMPSYFPGIAAPDELILDKGKQDGVTAGKVVVYRDNFIGTIRISNDHFSLVTVAGNKGTSFTAKTTQTMALGVAKGQGNGQLILDNVVLSESLQVGDTVVTNGDTNLNGEGVLPGLIVGKITSVEKTPSALFQTANVQSLVNIAKLPLVFVIVGE